jgi:hypothetical protein
MSARPARSVQGALREAVASMSDRQLGLAAWESEIPRRTLVAFAEGRTALSDLGMRRLGEHLFGGRYFIKREELSA